LGATNIAIIPNIIPNWSWSNRCSY